MVTIYALRDPRTKEVRYIGSTSDVKQRKAAHVTACRNGRSANGLKAWFDDLRSNNLDPEFLPLLRVDDKDRISAENEYIEKYTQEGRILNSRKAVTQPRFFVKTEKKQNGLLSFYEASQVIGGRTTSADINLLVNSGILEVHRIANGVTRYVKNTDLADNVTLLKEIQRLRTEQKRQRTQREIEREAERSNSIHVNYIWLSANGPDWQIAIPQMPLQYRKQQEELLYLLNTTKQEDAIADTKAIENMF
jgi:hypothetical protein